MFKRARIEPAHEDCDANLWFFKNTTALKSWIDSGANNRDIAMSEDAFIVNVRQDDYAYSERIGYELSWNDDNTYDTFNCVTLVKATPVPGEGITLKAYMGWASKQLLQFSDHTDDVHNAKITMVNKDEKIVMSPGDDDIEMEGTFAEAFARALKGVEQLEAEGSSARGD